MGEKYDAYAWIALAAKLWWQSNDDDGDSGGSKIAVVQPYALAGIVQVKQQAVNDATSATRPPVLFLVTSVPNNVQIVLFLRSFCAKLTPAEIWRGSPASRVK